MQVIHALGEIDIEAALMCRLHAMHAFCILERVHCRECGIHP